MTHETDLLPIKPGVYTIGYFALCSSCGWTGPERDSQGVAARDILNHCKENA